MRKLLLSIFALLLVFGLVGTADAYKAYDPKSGPYVETIPVFNNSGGTLDAGDVVVWQFDSSTGDDDFYVTTTTTADTNIVAGVVWPTSIGDQAVGSIAVWGIAECDLSANGIGAHGTICTSTTAGAGDMCEDNDAAYAIATTAGAGSAQSGCFINP